MLSCVVYELAIYTTVVMHSFHILYPINQMQCSCWQARSTQDHTKENGLLVGNIHQFNVYTLLVMISCMVYELANLSTDIYTMIAKLSCKLYVGVELRFSRHSPDWRVTQIFYSPNQRKTCQNNVFAEHLYSVHFVCTSPTRKVDHHDCVCIIIMNKSPCQVCVCISESGTQ
jgi:hypothetical protein